MIDELIGNKFKHVYYPATEFLMETIYSDFIDLKKIELCMYNLDLCKAFPNSEANLFNKVILELVFSYRIELDGRANMVDLKEEFDSGIARATIGYEVFDKYRPYLNDAILERLINNFDKIVGNRPGMDAVLIGWTDVDGDYDAGIIFI